MNKEIEEILNYMKQYVENIYEHDSEPMLNYKDLQIVLSYIEQLEKEIEGLKQQDKNKDTRNSRQRVSNAYQIIQNDKLKRCFNTQKRRRKEEAQKKKLYKSRIDKAIEYIENHKETREHYEPFGTPMGNPNYTTTHIFGYFELLDILKGDSDE